MTTRLYVAVLVYIIIISWGPLIRRFSFSAVECNSPCVVLPTVVVFIDVGIVYYMYSSSSSSSTNTRARELSHRMGSEVNPPHRIPLSLLVYTQPAGRSPPPPSPHPPPSPSSSKRPWNVLSDNLRVRTGPCGTRARNRWGKRLSHWLRCRSARFTPPPTPPRPFLLSRAAFVVVVFRTKSPVEFYTPSPFPNQRQRRLCLGWKTAAADRSLVRRPRVTTNRRGFFLTLPRSVDFTLHRRWIKTNFSGIVAADGNCLFVASFVYE